VHARRRTRIIHVRATTEFVGHAVDRGESRTRGLKRHRSVASDDAIRTLLGEGSANFSCH